MLKSGLLLLACTVWIGCADEQPTRWWKGNLHTHSLWSDGDDYPEMVVDWYKGRGYHFIQLSEHSTLAVDDAHNYHAEGPNLSNPGRGWIMVRAAELTAGALIGAIEAGDFYATTGVVLDDMDVADGRMRIRIHPQEGVTYLTQFIGTRRGYPSPAVLPVSEDVVQVTHTYPDDIGMVLYEVAGEEPTYELGGDELYVRAKVVSTKISSNASQPGEVEVAWTQPVVPMHHQR